MPVNFDAFVSLLRLSLKDPQQAARLIMAMKPAPEVLWLLFGVVIAASVVFAQLQGMIIPGDPANMPMWLQSPFMMSILQGGLMLVMIYAVYFGGRAFGGTGRFADGFALVLWLQIIMVALQIIQIAVTIVSPGIGIAIGFLAVGLFFWLLVNFIAALHGFRALGSVFAVTLMIMIGTIFILSLAIAFLSVLILGAPHV